MSGSELLPASVLHRNAVVYVRQSTPGQVQENVESQRRQYELVELARQHGFVAVDVIDDDLGRSASGAVARPGFDRLVAQLCAGTVGAVLCLEASRLARNGRDWHHLLELCGLVEARVIDLDGIYNPAWSKNSCSFLIVVFEQGAGPFPASNGHVTWILMRLLSTSSVPRDCGKCEVP